MAQLQSRVGALGAVAPLQAEEMQAQVVLSLGTYVDGLEAMLPQAATVAASLIDADAVCVL